MIPNIVQFSLGGDPAELLRMVRDARARLDQIEAILCDKTKAYPSNPTLAEISDIAEHVAIHYQLTLSALTGPRRSQEVADARAVAMWCIRSLRGRTGTKYSFAYIGEFFNRDHGTVMHAFRKIERYRAVYPAFLRETDALRARVLGEPAAMAS